MKRLLFIIVLIQLCSSAAAFEKVFESPDQSCKLRYEGASGHGDGEFFDLTRNKSSVQAGYFRYGPMVIWHSNALAEIKVPEGSPNYHSYFYNCITHETSPPYSLPIAVHAESGTIASVESEAIVFYKLNNPEPFYTYHEPRLGLLEFLNYCDTDVKFTSPKSLSIKMESCTQSDDLKFDIEVPNPAIKADEMNAGGSR